MFPYEFCLTTNHQLYTNTVEPRVFDSSLVQAFKLGIDFINETYEILTSVSTVFALQLKT